MVVKTAVVACAVLLALSTLVVSESSTLSNQPRSSGDATTPTYSYNVSSCPGQFSPLHRTTLLALILLALYIGYTLSSLQETSTGLTAQLTLAGDACNAFGTDIADLTLQVTYDTNER